MADLAFSIAAATQRYPQVFLTMLRVVSGPVNVEAEETIQGVRAMRAAGLIDDADVAALLF